MVLAAVHRSLLRDFLTKKSPGPKEIQGIYELIEFRNASMDLMDVLVELMKLRRPNGQLCALWDRQHGWTVRQNVALHDKKNLVFRQLINEGFRSAVPTVGSGFPGCRRSFTRPIHYMEACMALASWDAHMISEAMREMKRLKDEHEHETGGSNEDDNSTKRGWRGFFDR
ncbi:hypothetical protein B0H66DRAFT_536712 [Apodospora peruviana]|uniref:Uncharacterized protein n=1 Tax=Apodospora peruviana TaxID=516989 RepID=A0AAE0M0B0_9PEZI|nr:hypothetical protein B0H66DRAFT_536712 [Apodospora peruviana]